MLKLILQEDRSTYSKKSNSNFKLNRWEKALTDFRTVISLAPNSGLGYLGQGDSLKGIGNYNAALNSYTSALSLDDNTTVQALMKRGILYHQMKYYDLALEDFSKLLEFEENNCRALFFKAKVLQK
jgi:tetratricopeptide (TPR) repeat protein